MILRLLVNILGFNIGLRNEMFQSVKKSVPFLKAVFWGPAGSGKTFSSLLLADALSKVTKKRTAVIDSESSVSKYDWDVDVAPLSGHSLIDSLNNLTKEALKQGYGQLIVDSLSSVWQSPNGILFNAESSSKKLEYWRVVNQKLNVFLDLVRNSPLHIICTLRSKLHYEVVNTSGKITVECVGPGPIFKEGIEYEFDIVGSMNERCITVMKCRYQSPKLQTYCGKFDDSFVEMILDCIKHPKQQ